MFDMTPDLPTFIQNPSMMMKNLTIAQTADLATSSNSTESSVPIQSCPPPAEQNESSVPIESCPPPAKNDNKVMAAGVGAGVGVGLPLLTVLAGLLILLRKEKRVNAEMKASAAQMEKSAHAAALQGYSGRSGGYNSQPPELNGFKPLRELDTANEVGELSGDTRPGFMGGPT